jgi:hypothetical protein
MKKLMTAMLGLSLALGSVAVAFADSPSQNTKKKRKGGSKKGGKKGPVTTKKGGG